MSPRDLYFESNHKAAQAVVAVTLGQAIDHITITEDNGEIGWQLESASVSDLGTICAAGFAMEKLLGRLHDQAWKRSSDDRKTLATLAADQTGITLGAEALESQFLAGATSSESILSHTTARKAIDRLANLLADLYSNGGGTMSGHDFYAIALEPVATS